ncbi:hypothetical protein BFO_1145 [Tannerella forsythia 92A2]|uniref:Uncharacterized protein n=1 Tax=Tannerella forsythia (strain ATCC 43037 / JCM 10827 / CCUG 21028 A / KCTC 5666 / FDC 338) TaxID=203275 RepID=G8UIF8_TANFA|nr:hypothetical protein BFO_1145 [Tannerella forsythia 92A2]BAR48615.1 hypothetical protein TF3313_1070 [Tannerella forsythia 3313]
MHIEKQLTNNQQCVEINISVQMKIFHCFLGIYPLQQSH